MTALPVDAAARELGVKIGTLRRWCREGCPTVRRGRRGRGHALLVDPEAVRQWRGADDREQALQKVAAAVPHILAGALYEVWRQAEGMDKRKLAIVTAASWDVSVSDLIDYLRSLESTIPETVEMPESIERLVKIARGV